MLFPKVLELRTISIVQFQFRHNGARRLQHWWYKVCICACVGLSGFRCLRRRGICAGAHFVRPLLSVDSKSTDPRQTDPTAIGDERHCVFDCPHFQGLRLQHAEIFRDSHEAMRSVMWHKDQKSVCALVLAIVNEAQTL